MATKKKKDNIKLVRKPEYADMKISDVQIHGAFCRKPKEWHPELAYNSKLHQGTRIYTQMPNVRMGVSPTLGLVIELQFPLSEENAEKYKKALDSGKKFKIYVPKDRMIKISFDKNLKQAIRANNRRVGFEQYKIMEGCGELIALDIINGTLILKLVIRS